MKRKKLPVVNKIESEIFNLIAGSLPFNLRVFSRLYQQLLNMYISRAKQYTRKYHLDDDFAPDILNEAVYILLDKIKSGTFHFNKKIGFNAYLSKTMRNLCAGYRGTYNREQKMFKGWFPGNEIEQQNPMETPDIYPTFENLIKIIDESLPPQGAKVIKLAFLKKVSNEEGARIMGYKNEAVFRKKKSQYLKMLKVIPFDKDVILYCRIPEAG